MDHIAQFPKPYQDALAHWCAFRNLGFEASEIFFGYGTVSGYPHCLFLQLQTQGKTFTATVARMEAVEADVHATWQQLAGVVAVSSLEDRQACFHGHLIGQSLDYYATFCSAIRSRGIIIPELVQFSANKA
jgi:hypothetical protein